MADPVAIKLVIVGDGAIGKTCILVSYAENKFPKEYEPTVFDNLTTTLKVDGILINLGLWDTAGQQQFSRLRPLAYPGTDVFLIAFSVIEPSSFVNAKKKWYPEIQSVVPSAVKVFVGNKIDLRQSAAKNAKDPKMAPITKQTARNIFETELNCMYLECSALTREGLKEIFDQSVRAVLKKKGSLKMEKKMSNEGSSCNCQLI